VLGFKALVVTGPGIRRIKRGKRGLGDPFKLCDSTMEDSVIEDVPKQSSSWPIYLYIPNLIGKQFSNVVMAPDPFLVVLLP
jgi:hypothetical protein